MKVEVCENTDRASFRVYADESFEKPHAWMRVTDIGDSTKFQVDDFHFNPIYGDSPLSITFVQEVVDIAQPAYDWAFAHAEDLFTGWHLKKGQAQ